MTDIAGRARCAVRLGAAIAVVGLMSLSSVAAQDAPSSEVLARVGASEITKADVDLASEMFAEQLAQVPEEQRDTVILDALIDMHVVADAARAEGIDQSDLHQKRVDFLVNQALRTAFIEKNVQDAVTDEELRARYEKDIAGYTPPDEVNAAHILVETEDEANAVLARLQAGEDFAVIAKEKSMDPGSKDNGGDLGYFTKGQMVPEFETEAFSLAPGDVSKQPVKTQFGFHVIRVLDKRSQPVPTFETVREQILPVVQREKYQQVMSDLKASAAIERFDAAPVGDGDDVDMDDGEVEIELDDGEEMPDAAPAQ